MANPNAKQSAPIWARPAPGTRQPRLTREQIAQAALAIADSEGFAAVSMRRVALELDAGTMTLYYYVKTKHDLVALMDDAMMAEVVLPPDQLPAGWRAGLTAIARASRDVFVRHPWALYSLRGAGVGGPNGLRHIEQSLAAVADVALDIEGKLWLLSIVDDYVFGHVLRVSEAWTHPMDHKVLTSITEFFTAQLATGDYPHLANMLGGEDVISAFSRIARSMADDARFDAGLAALLDGMELRIRSAAGGLRPAPASPAVAARGPLRAASVRRASEPPGASRPVVAAAAPDVAARPPDGRTRGGARRARAVKPRVRR